MWKYNETPYSDELYHYGVKGMKWGVRKSDYKAMSRVDRKITRQLHKLNQKVGYKSLKKDYRSIYGQMIRDRNSADTVGTILAGPIGGAIGTSIVNSRYSSKHGISMRDLDDAITNRGREIFNAYMKGNPGSFNQINRNAPSTSNRTQQSSEDSARRRRYV